MKNVEVELKDGKLHITCDVDKEFGLSSSGKSITVASSEGNQTVGTNGKGKELKLGLNLYYKAD